LQDKTLKSPEDPNEGPEWKLKGGLQEPLKRGQSVSFCIDTKIEAKVARATYKDKYHITLCFPPLGGLLIIFVRSFQIHGKKRFRGVDRVLWIGLVCMLFKS
jgi:hypothetical protein